MSGWTLQIVGDGGHARDIAAYAEYVTATTTPVAVVHRSHHRDVTPGDEYGPHFILGMNDAQDRFAVSVELGGPGLSVIASSTRWRLLIPEDWKARKPYLSSAAGVVVAPGVTMLTEVALGSGVHVNGGAFLTRCSIGEFTTIGPNATICGDVTIGARCMIGAGAVIKNLVQIGNDVTVGAGAVVIDDVPDGQTVVGVPARPVNRSAEPLHRWKGPGLGTWEFDPSRGGWNRVSK